MARDAIPRLELRLIDAGEERERLIELRDRLDPREVVTFSTVFPGMLTDRQRAKRSPA